MEEETITALDKEIDELLTELRSTSTDGGLSLDAKEKISKEVDDMFDF